MAFHKNLVEKDLHAPSRYKVKNITTTGTIPIPANRIVVIHGHGDGLLNILPFTASSHIGLYGITETSIGPGEEAYITTFGILRNVPVPPATIRAEELFVTTGSATGELEKVDLASTTQVLVAISLSDRDPDGNTTILMIGGVPALGSGGGGTAPSVIEEFKGFFDPNTFTYPTDGVSSNDEIHIGDYFVVNVDALASTRADTFNITTPNPDDASLDIFGDVIVGDVIYATQSDFNGSFKFSNFIVNRTITAEEREILQDLKPADDGATGDILIVRD